MRSISSTSQATVASGYIPPMFLLLQMETNPVLRLNSTAVTVNYGGFDWLGAGRFGSVNQVSDVPGGETSLGLTLSGVPSDAISLALQDAPNTKGARVVLSVAILNPTTKAIADVVQLYVGQIDQMPITFGEKSSSIAVSVSHRGETFSRPKPLRNTDGDQQKLYPGDTSRRFVVTQSQTQDVWPAASYFRQ